MACSGGHARAADAQCRGLVCSQGQRGCRQQSRRHTARMPCWHRHMRCASTVLGACGPPSLSLLDLTCSIYHIPPRRACSCGSGGGPNVSAPASSNLARQPPPYKPLVLASNHSKALVWNIRSKIHLSVSDQYNYLYHIVVEATEWAGAFRFGPDGKVLLLQCSRDCACMCVRE